MQYQFQEYRSRQIGLSLHHDSSAPCTSPWFPFSVVWRGHHVHSHTHQSTVLQPLQSAVARPADETTALSLKVDHATMRPLKTYQLFNAAVPILIID